MTDTPNNYLPPLVPVRDSKRVFGWCRSRTYELAAQGSIRLRKIGKSSFIETASALDFIANLPVVKLSNSVTPSLTT